MRDTAEEVSEEQGHAPLKGFLEHASWMQPTDSVTLDNTCSHPVRLSLQDPREVEASKYDLNYIGMDGNIACMGACFLFLFALRLFLCSVWFFIFNC